MKLILKFFITAVFLLNTLNAFGQKKYEYPNTEKDSVVDTIWHTPVEDPYRWLEHIDSDKTISWLKSQQENADKYGSNLAESLGEHLTNYSRYKSLYINKQGKYYFSFQIFNLSKSASIYYREQIEDSPKLLFDPNTLDKSNVISIDGIALSDDNKTLALILSKNNSDWKTIRFLDMGTRKLLNDSVIFVKYSPVYWSGNGVYYIQYDVKNTSESFNGLIKIKALQYHAIGTQQVNDIAEYIPTNPYDQLHFMVTPQKKFLIVHKSVSFNQKITKFVYCKNINENQKEEFKEIFESDKPGVYFDVIGELNNKLLVACNVNAINGALYKCDPYKINALEKFITQYKERFQTASIINDNKIVVLYNGDKRSYAVFNDSRGLKLKTVMIPEGFTFNGLSYSPGDSVLFYYFDSFYSPSSVYKINLNNFEQSPMVKTVVPFSFNNITTEMIYYHSKDSTLIPMYITHKKNIKLDGTNPTLLYGYGGFGISMHPFFDANNVIFINSGGVLAVPLLRGGGDFPGWHEQGTRLNKQNTFDDFISAAEYLIKENYTTSQRIAAMGGSNGGLLVGACMTQRPDLFKVVVSKSGVLDMLRYHMFNVGNVYEEEYGNIKDSTDFQNLIKYSPVQNVKKDVEYPATLLVASDNDDRVSPFHSFKFISQLQSKGKNTNPFVLYYEKNSGHTGSRIYDENLKVQSYIYSFIYKYLGIEKKIYFEDNF